MHEKDITEKTLEAFADVFAEQGGSVSMFTVLDYYENKGREDGLKEGLEQGHLDALSDYVRMAKDFVSDFDQVYEKVHESKTYKDISRDIVLEIYNKV